MKKIKKILVFILLFMFIGIVNAESTSEEPFKFDWSKKQKSDVTEYDIPYNSTIAFKQGYVNVDIYDMDDYPTSQINYYSFKGDKLASTTIELGIVFYITSIDNYLYILNMNLESNLFELIKYDEELKEITSIELPEELSDEIYYEEFLYEKTYKDSIISNKNNEITLALGDFLYHLDKNLKPTDKEEITNDLWEEYYPEDNAGYDLSDKVGSSNKNYESYDIKNNTKILGGYISTCSLQPQQSLEEQGMKGFNSFDSTVKTQLCPRIGIIEVYDNNNELLWDKEFDEYYKITNVRFVNQYIVAIGYISDGYYYENNSEILVFDMKGNLLQKISDNKSQYLLITPSDSGFTVYKYSGMCRFYQNESVPESANIVDTVVGVMDYIECEMSLESYYLPLNIETKVNGEGTINVVNTSRYGEEITYEVNPKDGYKLDKIKITDREGNVVEYTTNTFTMPSSDVTIEVTFKKDILNPDTKDMALITLVLALSLGLSTILINYKKFRFLK